MDEKERQRILAEIRRTEELLRNASKDNPDIRRWEQKIRNLKSRLGF